MHTLAIGETLEDDVVTLAFVDPPTEIGEVVEVELLPNGMLVEDAMALKMRVADAELEPDAAMRGCWNDFLWEYF